jgi:hypothetical protein
MALCRSFLLSNLRRVGNSVERIYLQGENGWHNVVVSYSLTCAGSETALKVYKFTRGGMNCIIMSSLLIL